MATTSESQQDLSEYVEPPAWVITQKKTFTRWINAHLKKKDQEIQDIDSGLYDGLKLMTLINVLYNVPMPRFNKNAKMQAAQLDNVSMALKMVETAGIKLHSVTSKSIYDKNLKLTLGTVWTIIHNFQIHGISVDAMSAKEGLLLWCQRKTRGYKGVEITNFSTSWRSGLGFAALIHAHRPDLLDYNKISGDNPEDIVRLAGPGPDWALQAFTVAAEKLGITQLLDVEDMRAEKPDDKSVMTYVSEFFHRFASQGEADTAGRRVGNFVNFSQAKDDLMNSYVRDASSLLKWVAERSATLAQLHEVADTDYDAAAAQERIRAFQTYKSTEKPRYASLKVEIENSFSNLQTKLAAFSRPPYVPPQGQSLDDIAVAWDSLNNAEATHFQNLRDGLRKVRDNLRHAFADEANDIATWISDWNLAINSVSGELDEQIAELEGMRSQLEDGVATIQSITDSNARCLDAGIHDNPYTEYSVEELSLLYEELKAVLNNKVQLVQNMIARKLEKDRLAAEMAEIERQNEALRVRFAEKANAFVPWTQGLRDRLDAQGDLDQQVAEATAVEAEVANGQATLKEIADLDHQLKERNLLENKHTTYSLGEIELLFHELSAAASGKKILVQNQINRRREKERIKAEADALAQEHDQLKRRFADQIAAFAAFIEEKRVAVTDLSGNLQSQQQKVAQALLDLEAGAASLSEVAATNDEVSAAGIDENEHTTLSFEEVSATYNELINNAKRKLQFLDHQLTLLNMQKIPQEKLDEYTTTFRYFDKDRSGALSKDEFQQALQSLGENLTVAKRCAQESESNVVFSEHVASSDGSISFEEFVAFMVERAQDKETPEQVRAAFKLIANNKDHVLISELAPFVDAERLAWIQANAPAKAGVPNAIDIEAFVQSSFST